MRSALLLRLDDAAKFTFGLLNLAFCVGMRRGSSKSAQYHSSMRQSFMDKVEGSVCCLLLHCVVYGVTICWVLAFEVL